MIEFSNERSYRLFCAIADKIEADPALLVIPLANIERWLKNEDAVQRLEQWRAIIHAAQASAAGLAELLSLLRDDSEDARHLKSFAPFPGVLTREERDAVARDTCAFAH